LARSVYSFSLVITLILSCRRKGFWPTEAKARSSIGWDEPGLWDSPHSLFLSLPPWDLHTNLPLYSGYSCSNTWPVGITMMLRTSRKSWNPTKVRLSIVMYIRVPHWQLVRVLDLRRAVHGVWWRWLRGYWLAWPFIPVQTVDIIHFSLTPSRHYGVEAYDGEARSG